LVGHAYYGILANRVFNDQIRLLKNTSSYGTLGGSASLKPWHPGTPNALRICSHGSKSLINTESIKAM